MNVAELRGLFFLDTNILVYSFDPDSSPKQAVAERLVSQALSTGRGLISSQVVQEFLNVAMRKFAKPLTVSESRAFLNAVLVPLCQHYPSTDFYDRSLLIKEETGLALYDALIVTAAVESGCRTLVTEDLQDGQLIRGMRIKNPFAAD